MAALVGSPHCLMMCGPLCLAASSKNGMALAVYHLGRLLSYLSIGFIFGSLGEKFLRESQGHLLIGLSLLLAVTFVVSGLRLFQADQLSSPNVNLGWLKVFYAKLARQSALVRAFAFGGLSGILPCGFLYSFVLAAVATQSAIQGAAVLGFFWLGTLPALSLSVLLLNQLRIFRRPQVARALRMTLGGVFVVYGLTIFAQRLEPLFVKQADSVPQCHSEKK
jgi:sulfite exporter TauE/SafE